MNNNFTKVLLGSIVVLFILDYTYALGVIAGIALVFLGNLIRIQFYRELSVNTASKKVTFKYVLILAVSIAAFMFIMYYFRQYINSYAALLAILLLRFINNKK